MFAAPAVTPLSAANALALSLRGLFFGLRLGWRSMFPGTRVMVGMVMGVSLAPLPEGDRPRDHQKSNHRDSAKDDQYIARGRLHFFPRSRYQINGQSLFSEERVNENHDELCLLVGAEESSSSSEPPAMFKRCMR